MLKCDFKFDVTEKDENGLILNQYTVELKDRLLDTARTGFPDTRSKDVKVHLKDHLEPTSIFSEKVLRIINTSMNIPPDWDRTVFTLEPVIVVRSTTIH